MRKILLFVTAIGCVALLSAVAHAQCGVIGGECLDDPSFELATSGGQTSNSDWVLTTNFPSGMAPVDPGAQFQTGAFAASDGATGVWFRGFEGIQNVGEPPVDADITQVVTVPAPGTYQLTFDSAREIVWTAAGFDAILSSSSGPSVTLDLNAATYNDTGNMESNPTMFSLLLPGVLAGDTLTVSVVVDDAIDNKDIPQGGRSAFVDNFSLSRVPEPACIALGLIGLLGLMGLVRHR